MRSCSRMRASVRIFTRTTPDPPAKLHRKPNHQKYDGLTD